MLRRDVVGTLHWQRFDLARRAEALCFPLYPTHGVLFSALRPNAACTLKRHIRFQPHINVIT